MVIIKRANSLNSVILVIIGSILACNLPTPSPAPESTNQVATEPAQTEEQTLQPEVETSQPEVQTEQPIPATELPPAPIVPNPPPYACAVTGDLPDLVAEIISIESTTIVQAAEPLTWVEYRVTNYGTVPTPEVVKNQPLQNGVNTEGYAELSGPIQPCESQSGRFAVGYNDTWPPGEYTVEIVADIFEDIQELDETNNISNSISFTVVAP